MIPTYRIPTAKEAKEAGFVMEVVPHQQLMPRAQEIAEKWAKEGKVRNLVASKQVKKQFRLFPCERSK